jgi:hypothetical protein
LTANDFKAFALFFTTHRAEDLGLFRSLLARWRSDFPEDTMPLELSAEFTGFGPSVELGALKLTAAHEDILNRTNPLPVLVQQYAQSLMQTYSAYRSVFFLPPANELQSVLRRLIELDRPNRRVYLLYLAELAWDQGDDTACLQLGQRAFDPDTVAVGPIQFGLDPKAPGRVLGRMVESLWRHGKLAAAWDLCQQSRKQGYLGPGSRSPDPMLVVAARKVETLLK